jgi:hypothetical protein
MRRLRNSPRLLRPLKILKLLSSLKLKLTMTPRLEPMRKLLRPI